MTCQFASGQGCSRKHLFNESGLTEVRSIPQCSEVITGSLCSILINGIQFCCLKYFVHRSKSEFSIQAVDNQGRYSQNNNLTFELFTKQKKISHRFFFFSIKPLDDEDSRYFVKTVHYFNLAFICCSILCHQSFLRKKIAALRCSPEMRLGSVAQWLLFSQ